MQNLNSAPRFVAAESVDYDPFSPGGYVPDQTGAYAPEDAVTTAQGGADGTGGAAEVIPGTVGSLGSLLDSIAPTTRGFFDTETDNAPMPTIPGPPPLPASIAQAIDQIFNPTAQGVTIDPNTETGATITPTPGGLAGGVTIAPSVQTNNIFNQVINWLGGGGGNAGTANPNGDGGTAGLAGGSFLTPTNGAPLENASRYGSSTFPQFYAQGQTLDAGKSAPQSNGSRPGVAAFIRGLNLPGISTLKSDSAVILATLAAPLLALLVLWLLGKVVKK